jgi:hypothetical protein
MIVSGNNARAVKVAVEDGSVADVVRALWSMGMGGIRARGGSVKDCGSE